MKKVGTSERKIVAENRRACFDYEILQTFTAGIALLGYEVKSAKAGRMQLTGSYAIIDGATPKLLNTTISLLQPKNAPEDYDEKRTRVLLLQKQEIDFLSGKLKEKQLTLVPICVFIKTGLVKIELGLARSRKNFDKREYIKKRETDNDMRRYT